MMDESVILISSDDSSRPQTPLEGNGLKCEVKSDIESDDTIDYLPPVNFGVEAKIREELESNSQNVVVESQNSFSVQTFSKKTFHSLSESEESGCEMAVIVEKKQNEEDTKRRNFSEQSSDDISEATNKRSRKKKVMNADTKEEKARKKAEALELRAKRRAEQAKEKAAKKLAAEVHRSMKPGECMNYIQVHLDSRLLSAEFGGELLNGLQAAQVQYVIKDQEVPFSITWTRKILQPHVDDDLKVEMVSKHEEETEALLVCQCLEALDLVHKNKLTQHVKKVQQKLQGKNLTMVIYGAEQYFRFQKTSRRKEVRSQVLGTEAPSKSNKTDRRFESAPKVSKEDWERALAQLQLFAECNHRLIDQPQAMGLFVRQFTKAVAERPFKLEKQRREQEELQWFAAGDSRDCVRVDKDGNGIHRLWQQQLCQFNRLGMEISEAIVSVYKTPRQLVEAYENCLTQDEGEQLLASIPVRRGVGPLTTVRRVGPELSRRLYTFFTAVDGDTLLNHE